MEVRDIDLAAERLKNVIHRTPLSTTRTFSEMSVCELYLKCENQQKTGSFKVRGAYNKIACLAEQGEKPKSVVASSAGNHAQGVAFAAKSMDIGATIVMPRSTPIAKVIATEAYGAKVVLYGDCYDDAYARALEIQEEEQAVFIHPFNDEDIIAGQGTMAAEILRDLPNVDMVLVPAGGGGLLAGVAFYLKQINPRIEVIGVQAEGAPAIRDSFKAGLLTPSESSYTVADGISVKNPGELTFSIIQDCVDDMVTVSDDEICAAILLLLERNKQVVEPAGAVSLAAAINQKVDIRGKRCVSILSGGNIDVSFIHKVVEQGLIKRGRQMRFAVQMMDVPGGLATVSRIVAESGANIIMVQHDRMHAHLNINEAILHVACEVASVEAGQRVLRKLEQAGFPVSVES